MTIKQMPCQQPGGLQKSPDFILLPYADAATSTSNIRFPSCSTHLA